MLAEVTNALHRHVARVALAAKTALGLPNFLLNMSIELHRTVRLHRRTLELVSQLRQESAYDSRYLALAESLGCELWTADERLYRRAGLLAPGVHWLGEVVS